MVPRGKIRTWPIRFNLQSKINNNNNAVRALWFHGLWRVERHRREGKKGDRGNRHILGTERQHETKRKEDRRQAERPRERLRETGVHTSLAAWRQRDIS